MDGAAKYDDSQAIQLLAAAAKRAEPEKEAAATAAEGLLQALAQLANRTRIKMESAPDGSVTLVVGETSANVFHKGAGKLAIKIGDTIVPVRDLHFDPVANRIEGPACESTDSDAPRYRGALTVVVEQVFSAIRVVKGLPW